MPGTQCRPARRTAPIEPGAGGQSASTSCAQRRHRCADRPRPDRRRRPPATSSSPTSSPTAARCTRCGGTAATTRATRPPPRPVGNCADGNVGPALDVYAPPTGHRRRLDGRDPAHRRHLQPQLRAVRRPHRARSPATTCGSTRPAGRHLRRLDRLAQHRGRRRPARGHTPTSAAPTSCNAAPRWPTAPSPATPARAPAASTRTSTATSRHRAAITGPGRRSTLPFISPTRDPRRGASRPESIRRRRPVRDQPQAGRQ